MTLSKALILRGIRVTHPHLGLFVAFRMMDMGDTPALTEHFYRALSASSLYERNLRHSVICISFPQSLFLSASCGFGPTRVAVVKMLFTSKIIKKKSSGLRAYFVRRSKIRVLNHIQGPAKKTVPRLREFCSCCCLPLLSGLA